LRAGGRRLFGDRFPFHEAAFLGGPDDLRGLRPQRYAGDTAVYGNAELRMLVAKVNLLVPTGIGVFGLYDRGRVWVDGEESDAWHDGVGGGIFFAFLRPENSLSLAMARSEGTSRIYVRGGFAF
jgi:hemolysin activation/secretion protein